METSQFQYDQCERKDGLYETKTYLLLSLIFYSSERHRQCGPRPRYGYKGMDGQWM